MDQFATICRESSFFNLGELDDPMYYKNQPISLKFISSICQLPSFGEFNELNTKNHHNFQQRHQENQQEDQKMEMNDYVCNIQEISQKEDGSFVSTNAYICSGSIIPIAVNSQLMLSSPVKKGTGCNCKKTGCLKMYCQCFSAGKICTDQCNCCNCSNGDAHSETVQKAKEVARNKHRFAFTPVDGANRKPCNCKKTQCQKKYCQCYNMGLTCNELCKCEDCLNGTHSLNSHQEGLQQLLS